MRAIIIFAIIVIFLAGCTSSEKIVPTDLPTTSEPPTSIELPIITKAPASCIFSNPGFTCGNSLPKLYLDEQNKLSLSVKITNYNGKETVIKKIFCTDLKPTEVTAVLAENIDDEKLSNGAGKDFNLKCWKDKFDGTPITLTSGSDFEGYLYVRYNFDGDPSTAPQRLSIARITGAVEKKN